MNPGIYDISSENYHSGPGLSRSALMELKRSPFHYQWKYLNNNKIEPTDAMMFGDAFHKIILEHEKFLHEFQVLPQVDRRTKEGKALFSSLDSSKKNLTQKDFRFLSEMRRAFYEDEEAPRLIKGALIEKSLYWNDRQTGILCKSRPDAFHMFEHEGEKRAIVIDIKTQVDASPRSFKRAIYDYGYHIQCAMQEEALKTLYGIQRVEFMFIVSEKSEPWCIGVYPMDPNAVNAGLIEFERLLRLHQRCIERDEWPCYPREEVSLPGYAFFEIENYIENYNDE